ncbi:recombinase family protein [Caulobacter sp. RHG1]|uniref:recombinase family protein n=1 Tax=Caulobacter sp. (strain RHG1) TaxID=2545762 RepID=UPI0015560098|nr:recombinase family protein [Caulobacter sp. RHG1]
MGALIGYARTSTADQHAGLDDQIAELQAAGCTKIFSEKVSGVDADRPQLRAALDYLRDGDSFIVCKPDRLARSTLDLLNIVKRLKERGVNVVIRSMGLTTNTATGELILTVLAAVGSFERAIMLERQRVGIAAAKAAGKYVGRAPTARNKSSEILKLKAEGKSVAEIVKATGVSRRSVYRITADG